ncbi:MAG TPA: hypothetical protein VM165_01665 [Planctomycetaceae bacterium]|nr:hypothetical protein [Planctomycetaceae bacterium]
MIPKGNRLFVGVAILQIAMFSAGDVEGQLYPDDSAVDFRHQVITWANLQTVVPQCVVDGDWLLTGWGPSMVETPGLALVQLSTGKTLWTEKAEPEDWLTGWLIDDHVHVSRHVNDHESIRYEVRDLVTGAVEHAETIAFGPNTTYLVHLSTVFIAGHNEVFDRRTGKRRGSLPADVADKSWFRESAGRLYVNSLADPQTKQVELLEIDLASLEILRRFDSAQWFPDGPFPNPILSDHRFLIFSDSPQRDSPTPKRTLTAIDLEARQIAWQTEVAPYAPLLFVDDLSAQAEMPKGLAIRPLLIEWPTGRQRLGELPDRGHADLLQWLSDRHSEVGELREFEEGFATQVTSDNGTRRLMGLNPYGLPVWHHELRTPSGPGLMPQRYANVFISDRVASITGAYQLELVDLGTGEVTQIVTPETVGLIRKRTRTEEIPAAEQSTKTTPSPPPPPPGWKLPDDITIPGVILILLLGYLLVRRVALRPGGNPPGSS